MKKQYFKTIGSTLIVGAFLFLAFGSDDSEDEGNSSSPSSTSSSVDELDTAPDGYHKGSSCSPCEGTGYNTHDIYGFPGSKGGVCASCNSKGYNWVKD